MEHSEPLSRAGTVASRAQAGGATAGPAPARPVGSAAGVTWDVLTSADAIDPVVAAEWDELAVRLARPYCAPGWILAWRHIAPEHTQVRIVVVRARGRVVAVAPFYAVPWRFGMWIWSLMGSDSISRIEPLAHPDWLDPAAAAIREALAVGDPAPARVVLAGLPGGSPWPDLLAAGPAGGDASWSSNAGKTPAPTVALDADSVDAFLRRRSSNFRQQMRRFRRKLEQDGGEFRVAPPAELERAVTDLLRLHNARWDHRGGSVSVAPRTGQMLVEAGRALGPERFQVLEVVIDGKTICSQLLVAAGGELSYWNGGFDEAYAGYRPSLLGLVEAIRLAIADGRERLDLGPGGHEYKYRFTDDEDSLLWTTLIPRRRSYARARAAYAPKQARHDAARLLTPEQKRRLRGLLRRPAA